VAFGELNGFQDPDRGLPEMHSSAREDYLHPAEHPVINFQHLSSPFLGFLQPNPTGEQMPSSYPQPFPNANGNQGLVT
jgi:hypothetical protein